MDVISPKDAFVTAILIADHSHVQAGTAILTLDSVDEDLRIARVQALDNLRTILSNRLSPQVAGTNRQLQQADVDSATAVEPVLQQNYQAVADAVYLGQVPQGLDRAVQQLIPPVTQQKETGNLQLQLFDLQLTEAGKINDLAKQHLQQELAAADALKLRTKLLAPIGGKVRLKVTNGRFIRHGDVLFEISNGDVLF